MINAKSPLAATFWEQGRLPDCPILDMHAHMGGFYGGYLPAAAPEAMLAAMDRCNTVMTCFCSHESLFSPSTGREADLQVAMAHPGRFKAYHIAAGLLRSADEDIERMDSHREYYVGFKFLSAYYRTPLSDPVNTPYWEYADRRGLLTLCHTWGHDRYNGPEEAQKILEKYPHLVFIAGHSFFGQWDEAVNLARRYPNLYLELTAVLHHRGPLERLVDGLGSQRLLFGVDLPWFSYHHGIGAVLSADITDDDRRNILYRNAAKLLNRFPWFGPLWQAAAPGVE